MVLGTEDAHMNSQETVPTLKGLNLEGRLHPQGGTKRQSQCRQRVSKALWEAKGNISLLLPKESRKALQKKMITKLGLKKLSRNFQNRRKFEKYTFYLACVV